ncbi:MAG TPA: GDSL-type esterase/lipase family protein [Polyangiaceae bacterium]|nr:GDSL-type esterase/lipase family protein [Polyangiaceae bacterium]
MSMRHLRVRGLLGRGLPSSGLSSSLLSSVVLSSGIWLAACGSDGGGASPTPPFGSTPPANATPEMQSPGAAPSPGDGSGDSPSNSNPGDANGGEMPASGTDSEGVDPEIGLAPGTDGANAGANEGTDPDEPAPTEPTPAEPTPAEPTPSEPEPAGPITLFLAGDSIVQTYADTPSTTDQAGWGQMLAGFFDADVTVINRAIGGRTARRFIDEGRLDDIVDELEPGDFLLVQFGTNDGNRTATYTIGDATIPYFLDPATDFRTYLQRYVDAARGRGANPIFVTPTPRNSAYCTGGNGTGAHAAAMNALGQEQGVPVVDLNAAAVAYLRQICPAPTPENFFLLRADGTVDGTHFQENGARILASFVADGLISIGAPFTAHRLAQ